MLEPGSQLGSYQVIDALTTDDESVMFRARDSRGEEVAIRALPEPLSGDAARLREIEEEAGSLGTLDHPNIARVYGIEESEGTRFLITELVDGETLSERLKRGAIPQDEALSLAVGVAHALEAAHAAGIVHRDLGPSNIRITPSGQAKVTDIGVSGLQGADGVDESDPRLSQSPTMTVTASGSGIFSGTAGYMSPEQARGEPADSGSDIWAFGCILFEMLTGRPAFGGPSESEVRASVLKTEPDWSQLPQGLHPRIQFLIERCLDKSPSERCSDMGGVRADIAQTLGDPSDALAATAVAPARSLLPWAAAAIVALGVGLAAGWGLRSDEVAPVVRFGMFESQPGGNRQALQAISPELDISNDGGRIVFRGLDGRLYLRDRGDMTSRPLQITEETRALHAPLFSPDGSEVFYVDAPVPEGWGALGPVVPRMLTGQLPEPGLDLKTVPVDGGAPTPVLTGLMDELYDATFAADDTILFVDSRGTIQSVSSNGGTPTVLLEAAGARFPQLLPGDEWVLYSGADLTTATFDGLAMPTGEIVAQSLTDPEDRRVIWQGGTHAQYVSETGHIVYMGTTQPGVWAFPFDAGRMERTGDPVPMVEGVVVDYALAGDGALAFAAIEGFDPTIADSGTTGAILGIVDRSGAVTRQLRVDPGTYRNPRVSPDSSRVAYEYVDNTGESHIWVYDLVQDFPRKLTFEGENTYPVWKDDTSITYASSRDAESGVYSRSADGSDDAALEVSSPDGTVYRPQAWAPDESLVLVAADDTEGPRAGRLALLTPDSEVSEIPPARPGANEFGASLSPDGAWLAYIVDCESPLGCARVQRFPPVPGSSIELRVQDAWVQFSPGGQELVTSRAPALFSWDVITTGGRIDFASPLRSGFNGFQAALDNRSFDLMGPAGQEIAMVVPASSTVADSTGTNDAGSMSLRIDFFHNFFEVLRARVLPSGAGE